MISHSRFINGELVEQNVDGKFRPLGDKIKRIAQPVARALDRVAGTKIAKCGGCKKMGDRLNEGMPFQEALKLRIQGK